MKKALFNFPVILAAALSIAATVVISTMVFADRPTPPSLLLDKPMDAPAFDVTDHTGKAITNEDMLGKVWVCDFFLTRCNGICPILGRTMADLAIELSEDEATAGVKLISFSVDPEHDTPEQMAQYRKINMGYWARDNKQHERIINERWAHVSAAERAAFWQVVGPGGFGLHVGEAINDPSTPVSHSGKLVLVDRQGRIRGYYDGLTDAEIPALLADIRRVLAEPQ